MATNILIVEDSESVRTLIVDKLKAVNPQGNFLEASDGIEGLHVLGANRVDLIICDLMMPKMDGIEFLETVKRTKEFQETPVIILSVQGESTTKIRMLEKGASDYVTKPFNAAELIARVAVQLNIKALQDEMQKTNKLLRELSITDHLTHLYNRRYMMDALDIEFRRTLRKKGDLSLMLMDADNFKGVNDTYGHQQGDMVLAALAEAVQVELRSYDIAARYGGEEFAMVLPETSLQAGVTVAERLRKSVQEMAFPPPMEGLVMTISVGVAALPSAGIDSPDAMIRAADEALYRAKQNGRNRVEVMADPEQGISIPLS
jgi:two-component system, cell cycle response regulator